MVTSSLNPDRPRCRLLELPDELSLKIAEYVIADAALNIETYTFFNLNDNRDHRGKRACASATMIPLLHTCTYFHEHVFYATVNAGLNSAVEELLALCDKWKRVAKERSAIEDA